MTETLNALLVLAVIALLPLVPAVLLFRFLPSAGSVEGPMQGLTVKFGGAFAGYFALFLVLVSIRPTELTHYHTWTVTGTIEPSPAQGEPEPNLNDVVIRMVPPRFNLMNQGAFSWDIPVIEDAAGLHFPDIQFDLREYRGVTVPLGGNKYGAEPIPLHVDLATRTIRLMAPVRLVSQRSGQRYASQVVMP